MSHPREDPPLDETLERFVEQFGLWYERVGVPRMAGRILGFLLVCDPPAQTMRDIADRLHASMGSISTMTRMLERIGLITRETAPGERRVRFRVQPHALSKTWEDQLENAKQLQALVDRAMSALHDSEPERRERLAVTRQFTSFYIEHLPLLIADWRARQEG